MVNFEKIIKNCFYAFKNEKKFFTIPLVFVLASFSLLFLLLFLTGVGNESLKLKDEFFSYNFSNETKVEKDIENFFVVKYGLEKNISEKSNNESNKTSSNDENIEIDDIEKQINLENNILNIIWQFIKQNWVNLVLIFSLVSIFNFYGITFLMILSKQHIKKEKKDIPILFKKTNNIILKYLLLKVLKAFVYIALIVGLIIGLFVTIVGFSFFLSSSKGAILILGYMIAFLLLMILILGFLGLLIYFTLKMFFLESILFLEDTSAINSFKTVFKITKNRMREIVLIMLIVIFGGYIVNQFQTQIFLQNFRLIFFNSQIVLVIAMILYIISNYLNTLFEILTKVYCFESYTEFIDNTKIEEKEN